MLRVPNTKTATAFAVKVFMPGNDGKYRQIGTINQLNPTDRRGDTPIGGIGIGDRITEVVPGRTTHQLQATRFMLYRLPMFSALGLDDRVRMLSEILNPLDIMQEMAPPDGRGSVITWYRGCVVTQWGKRQVWEDSTVISEDVTIAYKSADDGSTPLEADIL